MSITPSFETKVHLFVMPSAVLRSGHGINWLSFVGLAEQMKAAEYRHPDDAVNYAAQQTLMRAMAASALGVRQTQASEIPVDRTCLLCTKAEEHGKPRIAGVNLNMSRTSGMVAGAFIAEDMMQDGAARLGADIERLRGSYFDGFDRVSLTEAEAESVENLSEFPAQIARLMLWTAKEAVLKATGHGLPGDPKSVELLVENFPVLAEDVADFKAQAVLKLEGEEPQNFWVSWQVQGEYFIAVALDKPLKIDLHPVTKPVEVKRILEPSF